MCGIHGVINGNTKPDTNSDDFIKSGFIANMLRGVDSSGIAVVNPNFTPEVAKLPLAGMYLPSHRTANDLVFRSRSKSTATICHVRAATVGRVSYDNAHPFVVENDDDQIVGVHNGTLTNWKSKKHASDYDVDSEWALSRILEEKADAFEEINGAFALVWWLASSPGTIQMARNKERPLYIAWTVDGNMVYASEAGMIHWLCERHRIHLKGNIKELEVGHLYVFQINDPTSFTKTKLPEPKAPATTVYQSSDYSGGGYSSSYTSRTYETTVTKLEKILGSDPPVQLALVHSQDNPKPSLVTDDERAAAKELEVLGMKGVFTALGADDNTGYIYGTFEGEEYQGDIHGVMRDVPDDIEWSTGGEWMVRVHGVNDTGNDFLFVVSAPLGEAVPVLASV